MIPDDSRKKLEQLRQQALARKALEVEYKAQTAGKYTRDMPSFSDWLKQRNAPKMAGGGKVKAPKSTVKAYKLFRVDPKQPGKLFPLFVDANTPVEMNQWVDAIEGAMANGKVKSKIGPLAYRPGWHAGDLPIATHIGEKSDPSLTAPDTRPAHHAWAEVEMPNDVDWQSVADERGTNAQGKLIPVKAHITDQIPKGGHYRYKTNSNMTGNWLIGGSMKVNRVLSDAEVARINRAAGLADLPRAKPFKKKEFGFAGGGAVGPEEWMAEEHVNHRATGGTAKPLSQDAMLLALTKNKIGMHSPLEKAAINVPRTKGTAQEFMTEASKQPGFKKEEVEDRKISFPKEKMTKEEFLKHLRSHMGPQIETDVRDEDGDEGFKPHHEEYTLPGGENYREVLIKRPEWKGDHFIMAREAQLRRTESPTMRRLLEGELKELRESKDKYGEVYPGNRYHFGGEPGIIASLRLKDRVGPNGEKILHVEEIQSDWHQEGRKRGYASEPRLTEDERNEWRNFAVNGTSTPEEEQRFNELDSRATKGYGVPDAPHKKSWHELALKHALTEAAKGGYHGIAITPGEQQADRYDLSKHINELHYSGSNLVAYDHDGSQVINLTGIRPEDLESHVGKEAAQKLMEQEPQGTLRSLTGQDLKVGGEGMKGFYDKIVPTYLNKLGKPHGAQVQPHAMPVSAPKSKNADADDKLLADLGVATPAVNAPMLHYFPIPDTMRQQIKTEGLPQYRVGGDV